LRAQLDQPCLSHTALWLCKQVRGRAGSMLAHFILHLSFEDRASLSNRQGQMTHIQLPKSFPALGDISLLYLFS
jgi:hypothetical protein